MKKRSKYLPLDEHIAMAEELYRQRDWLMPLLVRIGTTYGTSANATRTLCKQIELLDRLKCDLDDAYIREGHPGNIQGKWVHSPYFRIHPEKHTTRNPRKEQTPI